MQLEFLSPDFTREWIASIRVACENKSKFTRFHGEIGKYTMLFETTDNIESMENLSLHH